MASRKTQANSNVSADELKKYYRDMLLIRRFEEKAGQLYGMGLIAVFAIFTSAKRRLLLVLRPQQKKATSASHRIAITVTCWPVAWMQTA